MQIRADGKKFRSETEWRGIVERFESSGLKQEEFCQAEGVAKSSLLKWRKRFGADGCAVGGTGQFVEVSAPERSGAAIEVCLPHGISIYVRG